MNRAGRVLNSLVHTVHRWVDRAGEIVPGTAAAERFGSFGTDSCIAFPPATLLNVASIHLGERVLVGRQATLSVGYGENDPGLVARGLVLGDGCILGARTSITAHASIVLGDAVFCGQGVFITDTSHGYTDPTRPVGQQFGPHQPVSVGSGTWIGHAAVILPGAQIGRNVVVAAGAVVRGTVPDHAVVAGNPARVIRRLEPGVGWVGADGDVRPVTSGDFGG